MAYTITVLSLFTGFFIYLLFVRTEQLRRAISDRLKDFQLIEDSSLLNKKSKYINTADPSQNLVMRGNNREVVLYTCSEQGQLKNIYLLCIVIEDDLNLPGVYGGGRVLQVLKNDKVVIDTYAKSSYEKTSIDSSMLDRSESIEVCEGRAYIFFSISSYWEIGNTDCLSDLDE